MTWNPHNQNDFITLNDTALRMWDSRKDPNSPIVSIEAAHSQGVRDADFNPNRSHFIATCGDDRFVRIWDMRNPKESLIHLCHHYHWVWGVMYNRFHDQLLLSCGSDAKVNLESIVSLSSSQAIPDNEANTKAPISPQEVELP